MICPVCRTDMIVVERNKIELDYCTKCKGAWFDSGELELLLARLDMASCSVFIGDVLRNPEARSGERYRRCPICAQRMQKAHLGDQPRVLIDACRRGDGLWFDGGELKQLLEQLSQKPSAGTSCDTLVQEFLKDTFHSQSQSSS